MAGSRPSVRRSDAFSPLPLFLRTPAAERGAESRWMERGRGSPDVLSNLPTPGVYNEEGICFFSFVLMPLFEWGLSHPLISPCPHRKRICPQTFAGTLPSFLGGQSNVRNMSDKKMALLIQKCRRSWKANLSREKSLHNRWIKARPFIFPFPK